MPELTSPQFWRTPSLSRYWKYREPPWPRPLQPPYLAALFGSEDPRAAIPPDHCEGPGYTILPSQLQTEALDPLGLAPISARVVSGFNQRKSPSRTIFIAVDIWKAFETVSHRLFIEIIYRPDSDTTWLCGLWHTSATGRLRVFTSSPIYLPTRCGRGFHKNLPYPLPFLTTTLCRISPSLTQTWHPMPMTSHCWPLLPASYVETGATVNQLCTTLLSWADGKKLAIPLQKSSMTLFISDSHHFWLHPQLRIGNGVAPLNKTQKLLADTLDTHFNFSPHAYDCVERAVRALNVTRGFAGTSWGFTTETLVATYKALVRSSWTMCPSSVSTKCPQPIRTNLR